MNILLREDYAVYLVYTILPTIYEYPRVYKTIDASPTLDSPVVIDFEGLEAKRYDLFYKVFLDRRNRTDDYR
jgi:hypothetical protein